MKIFIIYGTNSGGTRVVSDVMADAWREEGYAVTVVSAEHAEPADIGQYDLVVFGSCTWEVKTPTRYFEGQLQQHFAAFRERLKGSSYPGKKFAVFGLGDTSYTNFCIAANHLEALVKQLGGVQVGSTLKIDGFFFEQQKWESEIGTWAHAIELALTKIKAPAR